ncbi:MAG: efflux RND transporter periplasmic adaptor subunit [Candidatus Eremiobacteraeota bacterium]|nr:efflux RND transporter periplasmic adaptor subunit [Candidatus Eremiobacteraeota bacterium]
MKNRRTAILAVVAGLVGLLLIAVAAGRSRHTETTAVREITIRYATFSTKLPESGVVQRPRLQTIAALVGGNIANVFAKPGDRVAAGQLLATIDNPQLLSAAQSSSQAYNSAVAHAKSAQESNIALPAQNRSSEVQAQAAVEQARARLTQARQDAATGAQSGLGYGGSSAAEQRLQAQTSALRADTDLREAQRVYAANINLFANKAISRDTLDQSKARYDQAVLAANLAHQQRNILGGQLSRTRTVLSDNVRAAEDALMQAQAQLSAARASSGVSKSGDVEAANADARRAASEASFAQEQAARTQIRAPFSGIIQSATAQTNDALRSLGPGDLVQPGQALFVLAASDAFVVRAKVDEQDIANVRIGQRAVITGEDFPGKNLSGHVVSISPVAQRSDDPSSTARQIITTIRLDGTVPYLRDGMSVDVDIITTDLHNVIVVPTDSIFNASGKKYVYVVRDGVAKRTAVKTGLSNDTQTIIKRGISNHDTIIAQKDITLVDGAPVTPAPSSSPKTL